MPRTYTSLLHLWRTRSEKVLSKKKNQEAKLKTNRRSILTYCDRKSKSQKKKRWKWQLFVRSFARSFDKVLIFSTVLDKSDFHLLHPVCSSFNLFSKKSQNFLFLLKFHRIRCFNRTKNSRAYQYTLLIYKYINFQCLRVNLQCTQREKKNTTLFIEQSLFKDVIKKEKSFFLYKIFVCKGNPFCFVPNVIVHINFQGHKKFSCLDVRNIILLFWLKKRCRYWKLQTVYFLSEERKPQNNFSSPFQPFEKMIFFSLWHLTFTFTLIMHSVEVIYSQTWLKRTQLKRTPA
jgi:hypothetical protein